MNDNLVDTNLGSGRLTLDQDQTGSVAAQVMIRRVRDLLKTHDIHDATLEAEVLVRHILGIDRPALFADPGKPLDHLQSSALYGLLERRLRGEPLAYILGFQHFYGQTFRVNKDVLIPRPETETLVEAVVCCLQTTDFGTSKTVIADVGTGSGCIAISLALNTPADVIYAIDNSAHALAVASENAENHGVRNRIQLIKGHLLNAVSGPINIIVANLPYVADGEISGLQREISIYEPHRALAGGPDGTALIRELIVETPRVLSKKGFLLLEFGWSQRNVLESQIRTTIPGCSLQFLQDLSGIDRVLVAQLN